MRLAPFGHQQQFGDAAGFQRIGQQAQALGQKAALAFAVLLLPKRAHRP